MYYLVFKSVDAKNPFNIFLISVMKTIQYFPVRKNTNKNKYCVHTISVYFNYSPVM